MARCSAVWPSATSAAITFASVFQSGVFISDEKSWSSVVGPAPSKRTRTLSFFFTPLLRPFKPAGKKIIHHQRGDERGDAKILLWIVVQDMQAKLVGPISQARQKFVDPIFLFVSPLANGIEQPPFSPTQIHTRPDPGRCAEELSQIGIVEIRIGILV